MGCVIVSVQVAPLRLVSRTVDGAGGSVSKEHVISRVFGVRRKSKRLDQEVPPTVPWLSRARTVLSRANLRYEIRVSAICHRPGSVQYSCRFAAGRRSPN